MIQVQPGNMMLLNYIFTVFMVFVIIGLWPAFMAAHKGKDFLVWYLFGVFCFPAALLKSIDLPGKEIPHEEYNIACKYITCGKNDKDVK